MTVEIKRTRLDGAFAQMSTVVRKGYVTVLDIKRLRRNKGNKKALIQIAERCNRYCHVADQPSMQGRARRIGIALRTAHGEEEGDKCFDVARDYRDAIPSHLWTKGWKKSADRRRAPQRLPHDRAKPLLAVLPPDIGALVGLQPYLHRFTDINRQLYTIRGHLGKLDRQLANRATESQIRGLVQKVFNDYDVKFGDEVYKLNSRLGHLEESHNGDAFTDAWQETVTQMRGNVTELQASHSMRLREAMGDRGRITRLESQLEDDRMNFQHMSEEFSEYARSTPYGLLATLEAKSHRHAHRRLPNPLRPIKALVCRLRLTVRVLMRGPEHPFS